MRPTAAVRAFTGRSVAALDYFVHTYLLRNKTSSAASFHDPICSRALSIGQQGSRWREAIAHESAQDLRLSWGVFQNNIWKSDSNEVG
jgi:hypothetical protein